MTMTMMAFMIMILMFINRLAGGGDYRDYYLVAMNIMIHWGSELTFASAAFLG